jgi:hypothetical protein
VAALSWAVDGNALYIRFGRLRARPPARVARSLASKMSPLDSVLAATSPAAAAPVVVREKVPTAAAVGDLETATAQTVAKMCEYIDAGARDAVVRSWAEHAANMYGGAAQDPAALCWAVFWLAKHAVKYAHDEPRLFRLGEPGALDLLIAPAVLVRTRKPKEDCDGFTMLICAMLRALLVESYIVTVAADPADPSRWSHVFAMAKLPDGTLVPLDGSHGGYPGWMVPAEHIFRWQAWQLNGRPADDVRMPRFTGLHGYAKRGSRMGRRGVGDLTTTFPEVTGDTSTGTPSSGGTDWNSFIQNMISQGVSISKAVLTPPAYQQVSKDPVTGALVSTTIRNQPTAAGAMTSLSAGGISPNTLIIGGAILLGVVVFASMSKGGR